MRLLVVEDDRALAETLARGLREDAYAVDLAHDGVQALSLLRMNEYDGLVLDVMLPHHDGIAICEHARASGLHTPILMLTARDTLAEKIAGLDAGADDYLTKPFEFGELLARLRALLRRRGDVLPRELSQGDLRLDLFGRRARRGNREIELTAKEFSLLEFLVRNAGRVVSRDEISAHVWDDNHDPFSNALEVLVSRVRRKIDDGESVPLIRTRRAAGYILESDAEAVSDDRDES